MPHVEINLQREIAEFYKNRKDIMKEVVCYSIRENEEEQNKIDKNINLIDEAWMEMEYQRYHKEYYMNFADNYGEKNLLEESDYVIFDLDEYSVDTLNGDGTRNWIYECELCNFKKKLLKNKKSLKEALIESYISVGVSLALLR
jgi:superoxide dismutase